MQLLNSMKSFLQHLLQLLYTTWVVLVFILPIPLILLCHIVVKIFDKKKSLRIIFRIHRIWIGFWEFMTGIKFRIENSHLIDPNQSYVFIVNHVNMLDILMVGSCIQHPLIFLAKKEILRIPFVGWIINQVAVMVDRSNKESRRKTLLAMSRQLKAGISILVFPEGTRNRSDEPLKTFFPGGFLAAIEAGAPILPVVITNSRSLQPVNSMRFFPGECEMTFLPSISTQGLVENDIKTLSNQDKETMEEAILQRDYHFQPANGFESNFAL